jgi:hypothetical protein
MFSQTWHLLEQEGYLAQSCLCNGLTALRKANIGDKKGLYYSAFFELAIGFERMMKLVLIIDYMASNKLNFPESKFIETYQHKLNELFDATKLVCQQHNSNLVNKLNSQELSVKILSFLDKYYHPSGRYANINKLLGNKYQNEQDPLLQWSELSQLIFDSCATSNEKNKAQFMGELASIVMSDSAASLIGDLDNKTLSVSNLHARASVLDSASRHAIYAIVLLIENLREVLGYVTEAAHKAEQLEGRKSPSVPFMTEFFDFAWSERKVVMRKRCWP